MPAARRVLIDGLAQVYRAFYAIQGLSRSDGTPTNALYGFIRILDQARKTLRPTHLMVAFDGGLPAHRLALVPAYKAQRPPMPEAMRNQIPMIREYLELAGVPQCRIEGCEADDVIATAVAQAADGTSDIVVVSADKDLFQLVAPMVRISRSGTDRDLVDEAAVQDRTGVAPRQVPAWLALIGDNADNIPGVPGIGPKTAARLLRKHGNLDGLWKALERDGGQRTSRLILEHREQVCRNLQAVILKTDLTGVPAPHEMTAPLPQIEPLIRFFKQMEFHQFARQLCEPQLDFDKRG